MTDPRIEKAAIAMRSTREFKAGASFGLPADAYEQYSSALATAAIAAIDKAATITEQAQIDALLPGSVVIEASGFVWKRGTGSWVSTSDSGNLEPQPNGSRVIHWGTE